MPAQFTASTEKSGAYRENSEKFRCARPGQWPSSSTKLLSLGWGVQPAGLGYDTARRDLTADAKQNLDVAKELVEACGCHKRDEEIAVLRTRLGDQALVEAVLPEQVTDAATAEAVRQFPETSFYRRKYPDAFLDGPPVANRSQHVE